MKCRRNWQFPFKGLSYEFRTTLFSPGLIAVMVIMVILSLAFLPSLAAQVNHSFTPREASVYFYQGQEYHIRFSVTDEFGRGISGAVIALQVRNNSTNSLMDTLSGRTVTGGTLSLVVNLPEWRYDVDIQTTLVEGNANNSLDFSSALSNPPIGQVLPFGGIISAINSGSVFSPRIGLQLFFLGPNGTTPPDYGVYIAILANGTDANLTSLPMGWMTYLGTLGTYQQTFSLPSELFENQSLPLTSPVIVELFGQTGFLVASSGGSPQTVNVGMLSPANLQAQAPTYVFSFVTELFGFVVPLMSILSAYSAYGRHRISRSLEPVLSMPVSHEGLAVSRYLAVMAALSLVCTLGIGVVNLILSFTLGSTLPLDLSLMLLSGLVVTSGGFAGLIFLGSRLVRSSGMLIGLGVTLFALFDYVWSLLVDNISILAGFTIGGPDFVRLEIFMLFLNPSGLIVLLQYFEFGVSGIIPTSMGGFGVTPINLILDGIVWITAPFLLFIYAVHKWD